MPTIYEHGRFVVIESKLSKLPQAASFKQIVLVELYEPVKSELAYWNNDANKMIYEKGYPWKADPRLKCIKRIILSNTHFLLKRGGWFAYENDLKRMRKMATRWNTIWPLHIMAKDWPLPPDYYRG